MIPLHDHFVREVSVNAAKKELSLHTAYPLAALFAEDLSQRSRNRGDRGGAGLLAVTRTPGSPGVRGYRKGCCSAPSAYLRSLREVSVVVVCISGMAGWRDVRYAMRDVR